MSELKVGQKLWAFRFHYTTGKTRARYNSPVVELEVAEVTDVDSYTAWRISEWISTEGESFTTIHSHIGNTRTCVTQDHWRFFTTQEAAQECYEALVEEARGRLQNTYDKALKSLRVKG